MIGGPVVGTVAGITGLVKGPDIFNEITRPRAPGYGVSRPGNTLTPQTIANRSQFGWISIQDLEEELKIKMGKRVDDVISRIGAGKRTRTDVKQLLLINMDLRNKKKILLKQKNKLEEIN